MACSNILQNHRFMDQWDTFLVTGFMAMVIICLQDRIVQWRRRLHALTICQKEPRITNDDEPYMFMKDGSKNKSEHLATATLLLRMVSLYCILCCFCCYNACLYTETNNNKFERVMKKTPLNSIINRDKQRVNRSSQRVDWVGILTSIQRLHSRHRWRSHNWKRDDAW